MELEPYFLVDVCGHSYEMMLSGIEFEIVSRLTEYVSLESYNFLVEGISEFIKDATETGDWKSWMSPYPTPWFVDITIIFPKEDSV